MQLQTDLEENAGNWAREVKPLMPNVPATSGQHFTIAPCTFPVALFSMYNVMVVSQCPSE